MILTDEARTDSLDREAFREMIASPAFLRFTRRIEDTLEATRLQCERSDGPDLLRAQGRIAALRMVLALPNILMTEMKGKH